MKLTFARCAALLAGATALAFAATAIAQSEPPVELTEVKVTGSRVITNGDNSPTPVTVISTEDIQMVQPTTLADGLNLLPVFSGSRGQFSNPSATGGVGAGNGVANQLNLRNIGTNRNLILFDGHRVPPTLINGVIDMDMIPQMLIERVDMVTGGVSAVYGSDAVTGVVNFITDRKFVGIKSHAQYGSSELGDGQAYDVGIAFGTKLFDGRGHFAGSYEYRDDKGVLSRASRSWNQQWFVGGAGTAANPYRLVSDARLASYPFGGLITSGVFSGQTFRTNGVLSPFVHGAQSGSLPSSVEVGGDGGYYDASLKAPLRSHQLFGRFDLDFTDNLHGYLVAAGDLKTNAVFADYVQLTNMTLSSQNAFLAPAYQSQLAAAGQPTVRLNELLSDAPRFNPEAKSDQYYFNTGLDGKLGDYQWGASFTHGMTRLQTTLHDNINQEHLAAALDAVVNPANGQIVCNTTLSGLRPDCVPLNVFGPTAASAAALGYVLEDTHFVAHTIMDDVSAQITGAPFNTWAGPVNTALSAEWRRLSYNASSDGAPTDFANCSGLRFNCTQGTTRLWSQTFPGSPRVSQRVWEGAFELDAPLVKDVPLVQALNLNGAVRFTSYDTSGNYTTWKAGLDWHVNHGLRFRATQSRDIRAPTLNDLYQPVSVVTVNNRDGLTGLSPSIPSINFGNPNLTAEIGQTSTAGFVWQPGWVPGLSLTLDAFRIKIENAITTVQGFNATLQQACYDSGGTSPYCALQTRPNGFTDKSPGNVATSWLVTVINISAIETYGADFEANYLGELFGRRLSLRALATYQPHIYYRQPALQTIDQGGVAFGTTGLVASPALRMTGLVSYKVTPDFTVDLLERWRSPMRLSGDPSQIWLNNHIASFATTNLDLSYDMKREFGKMGFFVNVQNVFNKAPPGAQFVGNQPGLFGGWAIGDDPIGRYYTVGVRFDY